MDRRRFKSRIGLHKGLQPVASLSSSQASSRDEPSSSGTSRSSSRGTPKLSNSEILRRQARSISNVDVGDDTNTNTAESPSRPLGKSKSELPSRTRKYAGNSSNSDEMSDDDSATSRKTPMKESSLSAANVVRKRQTHLGSLMEKQESAKAPADTGSNEKLLNKRKKFVVPASCGESDSETGLESSPLKMRRVDPRLSRPNVEADKGMESRLSQRSQLGRLSLSGRPLSMRRTHTQRESNTSRLKKLASPVKAAVEAMDLEVDQSSPEKGTSGDKLENFLRMSGITLPQEGGPYQLGKRITMADIDSVRNVLGKNRSWLKCEINLLFTYSLS